MSYTRIYNIDEDGNVIEYEDIQNAHNICMLIWTIMYEFYNDYFIDEVQRPEWIPENFKMSFSDFQLTGDMKPFWDLFSNPDVLRDHRIVFGFTLDHMIVKKENLDELTKALSNFIITMTTEPFNEFFGKYDFSGLDSLLICLSEMVMEDESHGVAMCTSLIASHWDKYSEDGKYTPYNINTGTKHWDLFEDINKIT